MGHANIYIRKENEDRWDSLEDKSAWVNVKLASDVAVLPLKPMTGVIKAIPSGETVHDLSTLQDRPILKPVRAAVQPIIKTKQDAIEAIKPLLGEDWRGPLFRDKKNKKL